MPKHEPNTPERQKHLEALVRQEARRRCLENLTRIHLTPAQRSAIGRANGAKTRNRYRFQPEDVRKGGQHGGRSVAQRRGRAYMVELGRRAGSLGKIIVVCEEARIPFRGLLAAARWLREHHPDACPSLEAARRGIYRSAAANARRGGADRTYAGYHWVRLPRVRTRMRGLHAPEAGDGGQVCHLAGSTVFTRSTEIIAIGSAASTPRDSADPRHGRLAS